MNLNCKLSLTDEQRNNIKRHLTGKNVKALAKRAEICQLIEDLLEPFLDAPKDTTINAPFNTKEKRDDATCAGDTGPGAKRRREKMDAPPFANGHDDCCRSVELLHARCRRLQSMLDQRGPLK